MASLKKAAIALNRLCPVWGICFLIGSILDTIVVVRYDQPNTAITIFADYSITLSIFLVFFAGRTALKANDVKQLKNFAVLVSLCWIAQMIAGFWMDDSSDTWAKIIRTEIIDSYDQQSESMQRLVQMSQQSYHCCGLTGWQDYGKAPDDVPASCCGKFISSPLLARLYGLSTENGAARCSLEELNIRKGCETILIEILASFLTPLGWTLVIILLVLELIMYGAQLLLAICLWILVNRSFDKEDRARKKQIDCRPSVA